ncbi:MAG: SDR family NAD(P)-dependent oxidoreductase [Betaproteobacteria bacterium]|nr:SDR family NAD(P)-dependent oxidoreductase [Betaproteobacteria bacterium]
MPGFSQHYAASQSARAGALQCALYPLFAQTTMTHHQQRVLITAAASGIGLAMADAFAAAGAQVFICDSNAATLAATLASRPALAGQVCDVSDEDHVSALFAAATAHLQGLDILVSNAGIAGPTASVQDISLADWRTCMAVNLDSAFLCAHQYVVHSGPVWLSAPRAVCGRQMGHPRPDAHLGTRAGPARRAGELHLPRLGQRRAHGPGDRRRGAQHRPL